MFHVKHYYMNGDKKMNDNERICNKCGWYDCDYVCNCPPDEKVYQCQLYINTHPVEVNNFNKTIQDWSNQIMKRFEKIT